MIAHPRQELLRRMREVIRRRGDAVAVRGPGVEWTYRRFEAIVGTLRAALADPRPAGGREDAPSPVGMLLDRSAVAYATMWAALSVGRAYVPLNPRYPTARLAQIVEQAGVRDLVCGTQLTRTADELGVSGDRVIVSDDLPVDPSMDRDAIWQASADGQVAYVLFTSGSTGRPKGVPISYTNLLAFVEAITATIPLVPTDVCSQMAELSFDLSVHEIYAALLSGSTLCPARPIDLYNPVDYVARHGVTVWIGVPSLARVACTAGPPVAGRLDGLRLSVFNGEALTTGMATDWQTAAPNTAMWNTYGPTECTVAVTQQVWHDRDTLHERGVVSIGTPLPGCRAAIDDGGRITSITDVRSAEGELLLDGPQRFDGYLDAGISSPFATTGDATWYRTGDRVLWRDERLYHLGRLDHQVKVRGHRIELTEVEHHIRNALGTDALAVVAHPDPHPTELVLVVAGQAPAFVTADATGLPQYMMPRRVLSVDALPTNAHGKLDRRVLQTLVAKSR